MRPFWLATGVIVVDQIVKIVIRTRMQIGESIPILGDWFKLTFTENPGMAFGISLGSSLIVTILAIVATILIVVYLMAIREHHTGYRASLGLILGGAIGNIIDRIFYAKIFEYGGYFRGEVVDFIHFDIWSGRLPEWLPLIGNKYIALFPIWNVADMAIVVGVTLVLFFQKVYHESRLMEQPEVAVAVAAADESTSLSTEESSVVR